MSGPGTGVFCTPLCGRAVQPGAQTRTAAGRSPLRVPFLAVEAAWPSLLVASAQLHRRMHHTWSAASPSGPGPAAASTASSKHAAAMQDGRQGPPSRLMRHLLRCCVSGDGAPACPIAAQPPGDAAPPPVNSGLRPTTQLRHRQQFVIRYVPVCRW